MKVSLLAATILTSTLALSSLSAFAAPSPKSGSACVKAGKIQTYKGLKYTCIKSGKKLVWNKGEPTTARQPSIGPSPKPSTIALPAPSQTPSPYTTLSPQTRALSLSEKWSQIDQSALGVFYDWATKEIPKNHNIKIEYVISDKADKDAVEEMKRRYELAARFWAPYSTVTNAFKVVIANHNEARWICEITYEWLYRIQSVSECIENVSNGRPDIPTAGQRQFRDRNVDSYQIKNLTELGTRFFTGRVEHEFTHNIFYEQSSQYQNFMPCWQIEGGPEFFGILIAMRLDANSYIQARNIKFETDFLRLNEMNWGLDEWINFLNEIDRTDILNRQGDTCGPVRSKIYDHSILANEYIVKKVGIPGYLKLIRDASKTSWSETVKQTFGVEKKDLYREMADYMMKQYRLARANSWSYQELQKVPYGR